MKKLLYNVCGLLLVLALVATFFGCAKQVQKETKETKKEEKKTTRPVAKPEEVGFEVTSSAFVNDADIPVKYAHSEVSGGENASIPLTWKNAPNGTKSFAIAMVDKSANNFLHWLVINIPTETTSIEEGASGKNMPADATEFNNSFGAVGYGGPAPPPGSGEHRYEITVYALNIPSMGMSENAGLAGFESFVQDKVLGKATISGKFSR